MKDEPIEETKIEARSYFVRERNALATRADFGPLDVDHYRLLMQHGRRLEPQIDLILRRRWGR